MFRSPNTDFRSVANALHADPQQGQLNNANSGAVSPLTGSLQQLLQQHLQRQQNQHQNSQECVPQSYSLDDLPTILAARNMTITTNAARPNQIRLSHELPGPAHMGSNPQNAEAAVLAASRVLQQQQQHAQQFPLRVCRSDDVEAHFNPQQLQGGSARQALQNLLLREQLLAHNEGPHQGGGSPQGLNVGSLVSQAPLQQQHPRRSPAGPSGGIGASGIGGGLGAGSANGSGFPFSRSHDCLRPSGGRNNQLVDSINDQYLRACAHAAPSSKQSLDPRKFKTVLCRNWIYSGSCIFGDSCGYAHGVDELRIESEEKHRLSLPMPPEIKEQLRQLDIPPAALAELIPNIKAAVEGSPSTESMGVTGNGHPHHRGTASPSQMNKPPGAAAAARINRKTSNSSGGSGAGPVPGGLPKPPSPSSSLPRGAMGVGGGGQPTLGSALLGATMATPTDKPVKNQDDELNVFMEHVLNEGIRQSLIHQQEATTQQHRQQELQQLQQMYQQQQAGGEATSGTGAEVPPMVLSDSQTSIAPSTASATTRLEMPPPLQSVSFSSDDSTGPIPKAPSTEDPLDEAIVDIIDRLQRFEQEAMVLRQCIMRLATPEQRRKARLRAGQHDEATLQRSLMPTVLPPEPFPLSTTTVVAAAPNNSNPNGSNSNRATPSPPMAPAVSPLLPLAEQHNLNALF